MDSTSRQTAQEEQKTDTNPRNNRSEGFEWAARAGYLGEERAEDFEWAPRAYWPHKSNKCVATHQRNKRAEGFEGAPRKCKPQKSRK